MLQLKDIYDSREEYTGEFAGFIIKQYGDILRSILDEVPDYPTWKQLEEILDRLEGVKFEKQLKEQHRRILAESNQESPIKEQLSFVGKDEQQN